MQATIFTTVASFEVICSRKHKKTLFSKVVVFIIQTGYFSLFPTKFHEFWATGKILITC